MAKLITYSLQEIVQELKVLEGKTIDNGRLSFTVKTVSEDAVIVVRKMGDSDFTYNLTRSLHIIINKINDYGSYKLNEGNGLDRHRYYVVAMCGKCPKIFQIRKVEKTYDIILSYATKTKDVAEEINKKRVIAIVGAGAALDLVDEDSAKPTTSNITQKILYSLNTGSRKTLLDTIQKKMLPKYADNFEAYFHVMEQLVTFNDDWKHDKDKTWTKKQILSPFFAPGKGVKPHDGDKRPYTLLKEMYVALLSIINGYNQTFINEKDNTLSWYKKFWDRKEVYWDVFTFNYDTTIEESLEGKFVDGYIDEPTSTETQRFNPKIYVNDSLISHTVNHMHGCILYRGQKPNYEEDDVIEEVYAHNQIKSKDANENITKLNNINIRLGRSQTGEFLWQDSIITGLHKTDKIVTLPYSFYRNQLENRIIENNRVFIVGYSFNDFYINHILESIPLYHDDYKIIIVDYCNIESINSGYEEEAFSQYFHDNKESRKYLIHFLKTVLLQVGESKNIWELFNYEHTNEKYIVSKNNRVMLHYGKFKEAVVHKQKIYEFLN